MGPMMQMYFHFRHQEYILFHQWLTESDFGLAVSCVAVLAMAVFFEVSKFGRLSLGKEIDEDCSCTTALLGCPCDDATRSQSFRSSGPLIQRRINYLKLLKDYRHVVNSLTMIFQVLLGYSLMMVAMTYNVPLALAVIAGHWLAFFFLGPLMSIEDRERVGDCCQ